MASSGWFARLLALGENNKLIAAATLVTLATGVPYLVMTAVRAVTGEEHAGVSEARIAELVAASMARYEAEALTSEAD